MDRLDYQFIILTVWYRIKPSEICFSYSAAQLNVKIVQTHNGETL